MSNVTENYDLKLFFWNDFIIIILLVSKIKNHFKIFFHPILMYYKKTQMKSDFFKEIIYGFLQLSPQLAIKLQYFCN